MSSRQTKKCQLYSDVPMMSMSLAYCLVIAPINILLKSLRHQGPQDQNFTSSDSEITSSRINLESNERYKRKVEWYNIWINGSSACKKVLKLSNIGITDLSNKAYRFYIQNRFLNPFTNLFSLLGFSSESFSVGSSFKSKLDKKNVIQKSLIVSMFSLKIFQDLTIL